MSQNLGIAVPPTSFPKAIIYAVSNEVVLRAGPLRQTTATALAHVQEVVALFTKSSLPTLIETKEKGNFTATTQTKAEIQIRITAIMETIVAT